MPVEIGRRLWLADRRGWIRSMFVKLLNRVKQALNPGVQAFRKQIASSMKPTTVSLASGSLRDLVGCVSTQFRRIHDNVRRSCRPSSRHRSGHHQLGHQHLKPGTMLLSLLRERWERLAHSRTQAKVLALFIECSAEA